ncbi:MAG: hypothetical protein WKF96_01130 [Solirubrobacteraceae bacterium]
MRETGRCGVEPCGFGQTYGVDEYQRTLVLAPPAVAPALPPVFVLRGEQRSGFVHLRKHSVTACSGTEVLDLVRLAWKPCLQAVFVTAGGHDQGSLTWILEHQSVFRYFFQSSRMTVGTRLLTCGRQHVACKSAHSVIRTVHPWGPILPTFEIVYNGRSHEETKRRFMVGEMPVGSMHAILKRPRIERHKDTNTFVVPIRDGGDAITVMVSAKRTQTLAIVADAAAFAETHYVLFTNHNSQGGLRAEFKPRS